MPLLRVGCANILVRQGEGEAASCSGAPIIKDATAGPEQEAEQCIEVSRRASELIQRSVRNKRNFGKCFIISVAQEEAKKRRTIEREHVGSKSHGIQGQRNLIREDIT